RNALNAVVRDANQARDIYTRLQNRVQTLGSNLVARLNELSEVSKQLADEAAFSMPLAALTERVSKRNALEYVIQRLEGEIEGAKADVTHQELPYSNWDALHKLAEARQRNEIPSASIAALFDATPEEMVSAGRWVREQEEIEQAGVKAEEREAELAAPI